MAKSPEEHRPTEVSLVPTDRIRVLNPRVRNPRTFADMVENIAKIGLKRPITVTRRTHTDPQEYDLVCGQGRLEAFIQLKQKAIPAIVIDADESDCLVMSLVENCARRQHRPIDLMREIGTLRERGYSERQIGDKIGVSPDYVGMIAGLLERGEERLVTAVETGLLPLNLAIDISKTDAEGAQRALMDAYTQKKLRGKKLAAARRLIEQREARGEKDAPESVRARQPKPATADERCVGARLPEGSGPPEASDQESGTDAGAAPVHLPGIPNPPRGRSFRDAAACGRPGDHAQLPAGLPLRGDSAMTKKVQLGFESDCVTIPVADILPVRVLSKSIQSSRKYTQITASIREIGLVEPPVVARNGDASGSWLLLDGHVRIEVLKDLGQEQVECLVSTDDEAFTYKSASAASRPFRSTG